MKKFPKFTIMLVLIILLIGAQAKEISDQRRGIQSYLEQSQEESTIEAALEPPRKPYSFKATVLELIDATPYPANETDMDGDGLPDSVEWVIGTDFNNTDTDFDNLNDTFEVYNDLDPLEADSNLDGYPDYHEITNVYALDIDNDGDPNAWDFDNDGDGVIDRLDESPNAKSTAASKFSFNLTTDGQPLSMTFQLRPKNPSHLTLIDQSWDWPWDNESTMQDLDNSKRDLIMIPWLRLTCSASAVPNQSEVLDYGVLVDPEGMEVSLSSNREFGTVVALTGQLYHPAPPGTFTFDLELLWKVSGFSDVPAKALDAGAGNYLTTGSGGRIVANTSDEAQSLLQWIDLGENKVALRVPNGPYLSVASDGTLFANGTSLGDQETFEVSYPGGNKIGLKAYNEKFLAVYNKVVVANSSTQFQFNLVDLGYYPQINQLVSYKEDFLLTGFSIEESYGSDIGLFYSENKTKTIAANILLDYVFLRNNLTTTINEIPPLENISAILMTYNVTMNETIESFINKYQAFVQTGNVMIPEILQSLPANLTLPIIICNEDRSKMIEMSDMLTGAYIMGSSKWVNLTAAKLITAKTMRTSFFNTSSLKILTFPEVIIEIGRWGFETNVTASLMTLFWKWSIGESYITQTDGLPTDFSDYIPELIIAGGTAAALGVASWDVLANIVTSSWKAIIEMKTWKLAVTQYNNLVKLTKRMGTWGGEAAEAAALSFQKVTYTNALDSSKGMKWLSKIGKVLCIIDVIASLVFFGLSIAGACNTAETYREAVDDAFGDEYLAIHIIVATIMYALVIIATIILSVVTLGTGTAAALGFLLTVFSFFLDFIIGFLVGIIFGSPKDHFHAVPDVDLEGPPEATIYDKDNNGLDVGDRIEILTHLVGTITGAGSTPVPLRGWSYIVPWISIDPPSGSGSTTSANLETSLSGSAWGWEGQTTLLNRTSAVYNSTMGVAKYDSKAWIEPGTPGVNFPLKIQMNSRYMVEQIWYHKWIGLFKCWHSKTTYNKTAPSTLTTLYYDVLPGSLDSFLAWRAITPNDRDGDGLNDTAEVTGQMTEYGLRKTDKYRFDSDVDGLNDKYEFDVGTDPKNCDTDEDGLIDKYEFLYGTNATNRDSDGDGIYDYLELAGWLISFNYSGQLFTMPVVSNPALNDTDGDGLSDGMEYWSGLNPRSSDTNGDGIEDIAAPPPEIIALLRNSTDIQQITYDIFNESCSISEFAVDGDGYVYAAVIRPGNNDSVLVLYSNLTHFNNWSLAFNPRKMAVDTVNEFIYLEDADNQQIFVRFNLNGTNPVVRDLISSEGFCEDIDVDSTGFIFTTENLPSRFDKYYPNGTYIASYGSLGSDPDQFRKARSIAVDAQYGFIYVLDGDGVTYPERIMKFNRTDGAFITTLPNGYQHILDLTVDSDGWVYVLDQFDPVLGEGCVRRFDHNGMEDRNFILTDVNNTHPWLLVHHPIRIEIDSEKNIYILENASLEYPNPRLLKFSWNTTSEPPQVDNTLYDWDGDWLGNLYEVIVGWNTTFQNNGTITSLYVNTEPLLRDTDFDGFLDNEENSSRSNPRNPDTDSDGLSDLDEWLLGTNITLDDTDLDGLIDSLELLIGSNPYNKSDTDGDGLSDLLEFQLNSTPTEIDTDFDGANDSRENTGKSNLLVPDTDGDFLFDGMEYDLGTNVSDPDTDDDDLLDGDELIYSTDPLRNDTDWDGAIDGLEVDLGLDPLNNDTDYDGLLDYIELQWGSNPHINDTDYDGIGDADDPDTLLSFPAPIVLAYDPDSFNYNADFAKLFDLSANITSVTLGDLKANYTAAPYIVLIGTPAMRNDTVGGLIYELMADAGTELTEMMAHDSHKIAVRYGVWTSQQTVIMISQAYPSDASGVFSLIREKNVTMQDDSISVEYLTAPILHFDHYYYGFDLSGIDMVKTTDSEITITYDYWARPAVNVSQYNAISTPHALGYQNGLQAGENALDKYLEVVLIANNSRLEHVLSATIKIYYRFADLDTNGDGYLTDPNDIDENQLTIYYFNETTGSWQKLTADLDWVLEIGINTTDIELYGEHYAGYIWAIVTHLSLYAVGGHIYGLPWWVLLIIAAVMCIGAAVYVRHVQTKQIPEAVLNLKKAARQSIRPLRYLLKPEYQQTPPKKLPDLPLDAISGVSAGDLPKFREIGIESIPRLADTNLIRERGKGPSDSKLIHGNSYAIDLMIHAEEPGIYKEIMPLEEILVQKYETTSMAELPYLDTVAIEGVSDENAEKLRKANINLVKELAKADIETIKAAGLTEAEAARFSECANWIMEYSKVKTGKPVMDNINWTLQEKNLILSFDITKELGRSASGKTILVANSRGGRQLKRTDLYMSMIAFRYPEKKEVKPRKKREMQNITVTVEGNIAKLTINRELDLGTSTSGKSVIVASSRGNKQIEGTDIYFGVNIYRARTTLQKSKIVPPKLKTPSIS